MKFSNVYDCGFVSLNFYSVSLQEEIESLVHRHPDKLSVGIGLYFLLLMFIHCQYKLCFLINIIISQIEKISSKNRGYGAEMTVVTYCQNRKESDDRSKFRILLVSICLTVFQHNLHSK